jgi:SAM-dependent methyltransferase
MPRVLRCQSCDSPSLRTFYAVERVPAHSNLLRADRDAALAEPTGELELALCTACGFVQNVLYDPALQDYGESYEDAQAHSPRFLAFQDELIHGLIERHGLRGARILEIGCGRGDFLARLCELAEAQGVGYDPAFRSSEVSARAAGRVAFRRERFSRAQATPDYDLLCCRHTLEHVGPVRELVEAVRESLDDRKQAVVYFEVPDLERILQEEAFWDLYYEHCSYFTRGSLARLFERSGFEVLCLEKGFEGQYLMLEARAGTRGAARPAGDAREELGALAELVERFRTRVRERLALWMDRLTEWGRQGRRVVLWGAGSKASGFLTTLGVGDEVAAIVDINPRKQGMFQAGTGHPIVAPQALGELRPDVVVVMNPVYVREIGAELRALGLAPLVETL